MFFNYVCDFQSPLQTICNTRTYPRFVILKIAKNFGKYPKHCKLPPFKKTSMIKLLNNLEHTCVALKQH